MKTDCKKRMVVFWAVMVTLASQGLYAQTDLTISGGVATVTVAGNYNIPSSEIITSGQIQPFRLDVVLEKVSPSAVMIGSTLTSIARVYPDGYVGATSTTAYASVYLPGGYGILGAEGKTGYDVRFISDPLLTIGSETKHVSAWGSGPISVPSGTSVSLELDPYFTGVYNYLFKEGTDIASFQSLYTITESGYYELRTRSLIGATQIIPLTVIFVPSNIPVTGVTLDQTTLTKTAGDPAVTLTATVLPGNATNPAVSWSTSNASVATVSNGVVNFVDAGTAVITVTTQDGSKTATCNVTVSAANVSVTGVTLNKTATTLSVNASETLTATVAPTGATNQTITWSSSAPAVATVSPAGTVTAISAGTATVTVTTQDGSHTASCTVTVTAATVTVTGVSLNKRTLTLTVGDTESLIAAIAPANATNKGLTWSHDNPSAITVDSEKITAVGVGVSRVIVTTQDGGFRDTCDVTVLGGVIPEYTVTISSSAGGTVSPSGAVKVKEGEGLTVTVTPDTDYVIASIMVDGNAVAAETQLQLTNVRSNRTVIVNFRYEPVAVEAISTAVTVIPSGAGSIRIESAETVEAVYLYTLTGTVVRSVHPHASEALLDRIPQGVHILRITLQSGNIETKKIIMQ